jgi:hypothetical protein
MEAQSNRIFDRLARQVGPSSAQCDRSSPGERYHDRSPLATAGALSVKTSVFGEHGALATAGVLTRTELNPAEWKNAAT